MLLLLPQRYVFSSKSQQLINGLDALVCCCCYHKGTYFQANHNTKCSMVMEIGVVVATTKVRIFKQITTHGYICVQSYCCCCYHKGTYFQANHNLFFYALFILAVVVATTKVRIFKQITTRSYTSSRYCSCCCYHKGTYFQANHNIFFIINILKLLLLLPQRYVFSSKSQHFFHYKYPKTVVVATTKVRIFKQITTYFF